MRQRVALARALAPNPKVLLMDEPFAALDAITREQLYSDLQDIFAKTRKTVISVTHNVREADLSRRSRPLVFAESGPHPELFLIDLPRPRDINASALSKYATEIAKALEDGIFSVRAGLRERRETLYLSFLLRCSSAFGHSPAVTGRWSPVLLPERHGASRNTCRSAMQDGTLMEGRAGDQARIARGLLLGVVVGLPFGMTDSASPVLKDTSASWRSASRPCRACAGCRSLYSGSGKRGGDAFRGGDGHDLVGHHRDRSRSAQYSPIYARAARTMGSEGFHKWTRVILPASLPFLVSGVKQGWAFAWRSLMAAEIYVTILSGFGLGQILHYGRELHAMDQVIGVMLVIVLIGAAADRSCSPPGSGFCTAAGART